jgi:uncharacterized protein YbjT (DUF2867 family)
VKVAEWRQRRTTDPPALAANTKGVSAVAIIATSPPRRAQLRC